MPGPPYKWNGFADRSFNPAIGCSRGCDYCWARRMAKRQKPKIRTVCSDPQCDDSTWDHDCDLGEVLRGCVGCYDFKVHDHFERWEKFRARPGERIALGYMGDLFDPARGDHAIWEHLNYAQEQCDRTGRMPDGSIDLKKACVWLLQTRHVSRAVEFCNDKFGVTPDGKPRMYGFEIGTTFAGPEDLDNVRALGELPEGVVRFIAFEPCDFWLPTELYWVEPTLSPEHDDVRKAISAARPNWAYIGAQTPVPHISQDDKDRIASIAAWLNDLGCKVIFKPSCGPELHEITQKVRLP